MKRAFLAVLLITLSAAVFADETVRGYVRRDGTYVAPSHRTESNQFRFDNYSSQGNTNPYTGQAGHKPNEFSTPPVYNQSNPYGGSVQPAPSYPSPNPYGMPRQRSLY